MCSYKILTDSCANLPSDLIDEMNIGVIPLSYISDGKIIQTGSGSLKEFYDSMRNKNIYKTAALNENDYYAFFKQYLLNGEDIIYIGFSSGLSSSINNAFMAKEILRSEFPGRKIYVIDSISASLGLGLLVYYANKKKEGGMNIEDVYYYIENIKSKMLHYFTVDDLSYLYRGGRLSKTSFLLGNALRLKPIIHLNIKGKMNAIGKTIGKKKALNEMVDRLIKNSVNIETQVVGIAHADSVEEANYVKERLLNLCKPKGVIISEIDQTIGAHSGPGTIAIFALDHKREN